MSYNNPITIPAGEHFAVGESDFRNLCNHPMRCESGAFLLVTSGSADVTINLHCNEVGVNTVMLFLPGSIFLFTDMSDDFRISYCAFSRDLFSEAGFRLDPSFFRFLGENPILVRNEGNVKGAEGWLQMAAYIYNDRENIFRNTIMKNRLQNIFLEMYDKLQRNMKCSPKEGTSRQMELFHKFIALVHEHCIAEREVTFYADKLCITTRYLSAIVRNVSHESAKEIIDRMVLLEIKVLLQSTDLSIQEIAIRLHFPDQSYFGRYFRKHTGKSPSEYRSLMQ